MLSLHGALACLMALAPLSHAIPMNVPSFQPGLMNYTVAEVAPLIADATDAIDDHYMVVLKEDVASAAFVQHRERIEGAQGEANVFAGTKHAMRHVFNAEGLKGYAGAFSDDVLAYIRAQPEVAYIEKDSVVKTMMIPQGNEHVRDMPETAAATRFPWENPFAHQTEIGAPWGLARISHRPGLTLGTFNKYVYEEAGGEGVVAYVIDTGINTRHEDFEGRASWGVTIPKGDTDTDSHGHGTHCAGTIGSKTYGVAKKAEIVAVKVLGSGGQGSMSDVTAGVLWAVADAKARTAAILADPTAAQKHKGFVASMSLGGGKSPTLDRAVDGAVGSGLHFAVAAGNENQDACNVSPAGAKKPVTVGASTIADDRAYFSNWGPCVDIFGPGLNVLSTWNSGPRALNTLSGTSMATPHIAGLMAYLLSIYGSADFAKLAAPTAVPARRSQRAAVRAWAHKALFALHAFLPTTLQPVLDAYLPLDEHAAVSFIDSALHPKDMKAALGRFASKGVLGGLEEDTVNKLAYNNATTVA